MRSKSIVAVICLIAGTALTAPAAARSVGRPLAQSYASLTNEGKERSSAQVRKPARPNFKTWSIHSSVFLGLREGGRDVSLDSQGNLEKRRKNQETKTTVDAADLQEIAGLLRELNLARAKTKTVKGKRIYDFPYSSFTINLDGKSFLMEGSSFYDAKFVVMTKKGKQAFSKLKEKLNAIGAVR